MKRKKRKGGGVGEVPKPLFSNDQTTKKQMMKNIE
jgi:ribosomal protein L44E